MIIPTSLDDFLKLRERGIPILDVRSPAEYERAALEGAYNLPLFTNEERAEVGTLYVQKGRDIAVEVGLGYVGPKMVTLVQLAKAYARENGVVGVYCARGGMRSGSVAWLLSTAGLTVYQLEGGYRSYHRAMIELPLRYRFIILGGSTGCGKTEVLQALRARGAQVVDLEALAHHRGSVFGGFPGEPQPSGERFLNLIGEAFEPLDPQQPVFLEGESEMIGHCALMPDFWQQMQQAPFLSYSIPYEARVARIVREYGSIPIDILKHSFYVIRKRLGGLSHSQAQEALDRGDLTTAVRLALVYYDRTYGRARTSSSWQTPRQHFELAEDNPHKAAQTILEWLQSHPL